MWFYIIRLREAGEGPLSILRSNECGPCTHVFSVYLLCAGRVFRKIESQTRRNWWHMSAQQVPAVYNVVRSTMTTGLRASVLLTKAIAGSSSSWQATTRYFFTPSVAIHVVQSTCVWRNPVSNKELMVHVSTSTCCIQSTSLEARWPLVNQSALTGKNQWSSCF